MLFKAHHYSYRGAGKALTSSSLERLVKLWGASANIPVKYYTCYDYDGNVKVFFVKQGIHNAFRIRLGVRLLLYKEIITEGIMMWILFGCPELFPLVYKASNGSQGAFKKCV